ncbi:hypothetical protein [Bacillus sp. FJAT-50079]|uniref:hypothetical protein n=1 Tax=Bacillus sp. FJAT-50079 TaxID=2833577 RepID=UPI001BC9DD13|nr:hypothetical protein [Bacillus sp. FJAT-50079]MBS4209613.1 hypothetical protein [Bacillus sp. FJAT-50079]
MRREFQLKSEEVLIIRNEQGMIYPLTLVITLITLFILIEATHIYVSEYGYVTEMKHYYESELRQLLLNIDATNDKIDYNTIRNINL